MRSKQRTASNSNASPVADTSANESIVVGGGQRSGDLGALPVMIGGMAQNMHNLSSDQRREECRVG
jgi:hypothetical protein